MKATLTEYEGCFAIDLEAETMKEAALIIRAGVNTLKELRSLDSYAQQEGEFRMCVVVGKRKDASTELPHRT